MKNIIAVALLSFTFIACSSKTVELTNLEKVPAAQVTLTTDEADDGMIEYELDVKHLAPADKVAEDASSYVAWIEPVGAEISAPQNIGHLDLKDNLSANLEGKTPFKNFNFFITAEETTVATAPAGEKIFESQVNRE